MSAWRNVNQLASGFPQSRVGQLAGCAGSNPAVLSLYATPTTGVGAKQRTAATLWPDGPGIAAASTARLDAVSYKVANSWWQATILPPYYFMPTTRLISSMQAKQPTTKANKRLEIATHCTVASHHWLAPFVPEQAPGALPIAMLGVRVRTHGTPLALAPLAAPKLRFPTSATRPRFAGAESLSPLY